CAAVVLLPLSGQATCGAARPRPVDPVRRTGPGYGARPAGAVARSHTTRDRGTHAAATEPRTLAGLSEGRRGQAMACVRCGSRATRRDGQTRLGGQRWRCNVCERRFTARSASAFSGHCYPDDLIALAVRWYARFRLSYADVAEWLAERGFT